MTKRLLTTQKIVNLSSDPVSGVSGELYYNTSINAYKFYNGSEWVEIGGSQQNTLVPSGSSYPDTSLENGQLFYNTTNGRTAIYFDSLWKEFAYVVDSFSLDGGNPYTTSFFNNVDNGSSSEMIFVGPYDSGNP